MSRLVDIGKEMVEKRVIRNPFQQLFRWMLRKILPYPKRFGFFLKIGQFFQPFMFGPFQEIKSKIPTKQHSPAWPENHHDRKMLALAGCAQSVATPKTNAVTARVLNKLGISLIEVSEAGCCGAVDYHLGKHDDGLNAMRKNIDAWWPAIEAGAEAIVMTASGCGVMVEEYAELLAHDHEYADKAKKVSELTKDISQILVREDLSKLKLNEKKSRKTAFHCPCTLQHGMKLTGLVESILTEVGVPLTETIDSHMCCGSAGTYSILQQKTSQCMSPPHIALWVVFNNVLHWCF